MKDEHQEGMLESIVSTLSQLPLAIMSVDINDPEYLKKTINIILTSVKETLQFKHAEFLMFRKLDGAIPKPGEIGPDPRLNNEIRLHWVTGVGYDEEYLEYASNVFIDINATARGPPYSLYLPKFKFEPLVILDNEEYMSKIEQGNLEDYVRGLGGRFPKGYLKTLREQYEFEEDPQNFPRGFPEFAYQVYIPTVRELDHNRREKEMFGLIALEAPEDGLNLHQPPSEEKMKMVKLISSLAQFPILTAAMVYELKTTNNKLEDTLKSLKEAQEIIARTRAQMKYAEISEQINHQINTLMLGVLPGVNHLSETNSRYAAFLSQLISKGFSEEDRRLYLEIGEFLKEHAKKNRTLTGLEFIKAKKSAQEYLSAKGISLDSMLIDEFARMQLPAEVSEKLFALYGRHGPDIVRAALMLYDINRSLTTIKNSSERIANLVSAVRDYTYGGEANNYDVRKGIESTLLVMEVKLGGVVVERKYLDKQLSPITCYPGALDQVWTNIINNAVEAGAKKIVIDAYMKDEQSIAVRIENDGPQIPPEVLPKIFDRYFSTKSSATAEEERGIGLYMVKEIIEKQHCGRIEVYSDPQKTYFEIILPVMKR